MSGAPKIQITLACAYCFAKLNFSQPAITLQTKSGSLARAGKVCELKCPQCGSTFAVELSTKRVRQGAGFKRQEAKKRELHEANVAEAVQRNMRIAAKLLAQPGCTCGASVAGLQRSLGDDAFARRLAEYGHAFNSCGASYGIPTVPHHNHGCPCRGSFEENTIRGTKGAA